MRIVIKLLLLTVVMATAWTTGADALDDALNDPNRPEADQARDARSRPDVTIPLLNLAAGDRVADIFGGSGYYASLLSRVVGPDGEVVLHNNTGYRNFASDGLKKRFGDTMPGGISDHVTEADDLALGELDGAMMIMSYHDLYWVSEENGWPAIDAKRFVGQVYDALKPGGRFLIVDHAAEAGSGSSAAQVLHRIDPAYAKQDIESHGFVLVDESDALANPGDDYTINVFDEKVRGKTNRFIHVYEKPAQ